MTTPAERLDSAFGEQSAAILADGGLGATWDDALRAVPADLVRVEDPGTAILARLREFWSQQGDLRPAIAATRALLRWNAEHRGSDHVDTLVELSALGALALRAGRAAEGGGLVERAWAAVEGRVAPEDPRLAVLAQNVARWFAETSRLAEADRALALALRIRSRTHPEGLGMLSAQRGEILARLDRHAEAVPLLESALGWYEKTFGADHPATVARRRALASALGRVGKVREALPLWRSAHQWLSSSGDDEARAGVAFELGAALEQLDERAEALRMLEEAVRYTRGAGTEARPHPELPARVTTYANAELRRGRPAVAEGLLREALEAERRLSGDRSAAVAERYATLGALLARGGRVDEALGWLDTAASLLRSQAGDADPRTVRVADSLVGLLLVRAEHALGARDRQLAAVALARAWEVAAPVLGFVHEKTRKVRDLRDRHRLT